MALHEYLERAAKAHPENIAVEEPGAGALTYRELALLSDRLRDRLCHLGVCPGDRVGLHLHKSIDAIVSIFGILKAGAAYVPVDCDTPPARCAYILDNCSVRVIISEQSREAELRAELDRLGAVCRILPLQKSGVPLPIARYLEEEDRRDPAPATQTVYPGPESLAYILYTSGSTGKPKGVMLAHRSATSYIDWCTETFAPKSGDRFSSHAPLHFDLSILDIFLPLKHGATLVLIGEELGKDPLKLAAVIAETQLSIWYSTPSILNLLAQYGKLERHDFSAVRIVLFAGEVFPVPQLRTLRALWPGPRYFNLYGPTETNVCTFYELPPTIPPGRTDPFPIGRTCSHVECAVIDPEERPVPQGEEGELVVSGAGLMLGYWNLPEQNARAFLMTPGGKVWYRTGDLVVEEPDGNYIFHGRRDRMVKRRGYRVELGEVEAGLSGHPALREVAVVALTDGDAVVKIKAFVSSRANPRPSLIELKAFCVEKLPRYMVPDLFAFVDALPRTSTDKIDYQTLKAQG